MKLLVATMLVLVALANAEPPRFRSIPKRSPAPIDSPPYAPSGWRPSGADFTLPQRQTFGAPQQTYAAPPQTYGAPPPNYGAPPQNYGPPQTYGPPPQATTKPKEPEPTTTEIPTTTEMETEATTTEQPQLERIKDNTKSSKVQESSGSPVYYVLPQRQNYLYTFQQSAPLVAVPQTTVLTSSRLQTFQLNQPAFNTIYTPFQQLVQIYQ